MSNVLVMYVVAALVLLGGLAATTQIVKLAVRTDNGQLAAPADLPSAPNSTSNLLAQMTVLQVWFANIPMALTESPLGQPVHPVIKILMDDAHVTTLQLSDDRDWAQLSFSDLMPCNEFGVPLDMNYTAPNFEESGYPVDIQTKAHLMDDWQFLTTVLIETNKLKLFRDESRILNEGEAYYRAVAY